MGIITANVELSNLRQPQLNPLNVWIPSKDTGVDLLITHCDNRKSASLQVEFSKDFVPEARRESSIKSCLLATGWWTHDQQKIENSRADFWVFVLPSFLDHRTSFIIIPSRELLRRLRSIHGHCDQRVQSYFCITKPTKSTASKCWEHRGLGRDDLKKIGEDCFANELRDFSVFLDAWNQIEKVLR